MAYAGLDSSAAHSPKRLTHRLHAEDIVMDDIEIVSMYKRCLELSNDLGLDLIVIHGNTFQLSKRGASDQYVFDSKFIKCIEACLFGFRSQLNNRG